MLPSKRIRLADGSGNESANPNTECNGTSNSFEPTKILWEVDNISKLDNKWRYTPAVENHGLTWQMIMYKNADWLGMHLKGMDNDSTMWNVNVDLILSIINDDHNCDKIHVLKKVTFCHNSYAKGQRQFISWNDLVDPEKGYVRDDKIRIEVCLHIINVSGIRKSPTFDFTNSNDPRHELTLVIGEKKLHVSKEFLAIHSPVLRAMLYGKFEEGDKKEVELKEVQYEDVLEMLQVMYPSGKKITDATVERLLAVGDYFQIKMILDQAEDYLIASTTYNVAAKLKLSGEYRLVHLQGHCLKSFTTIADIKKLKDAKEYNEFSDATKLSLLEKIMKLPD